MTKTFISIAILFATSQTLAFPGKQRLPEQCTKKERSILKSVQSTCRDKGNISFKTMMFGSCEDKKAMFMKMANCQKTVLQERGLKISEDCGEALKSQRQEMLKDRLEC